MTSPSVIVKVTYKEEDDEGNFTTVERVGWLGSIQTGKLYLAEIKGAGCNGAIPVQEITTMIVLPYFG